MAKPVALDEGNDEGDLQPSTVAPRVIPPPNSGAVPPLARGKIRPDRIEQELSRWYRLSEAERAEALKEAIRGSKVWGCEVFVHVCVQAYGLGRKAFNDAFPALVTRAKPLLLSQAWGSAKKEREDQLQEIFAHTCTAIMAEKADFAECNFASFAKRKAISLHRSRDSSKDAYNLVASVPDVEALEDAPQKIRSPENQALLSSAIGKLKGRLQTVFIQYHVLGLTYEEIAHHYGVDESAVRLWMKAANAQVGLQGEKK